jgi:hypothetical protein
LPISISSFLLPPSLGVLGVPGIGVLAALMVSIWKPSRISRRTHHCSAMTIWATVERERTSQKKKEEGKEEE